MRDITMAVFGALSEEIQQTKAKVENVSAKYKPTAYPTRDTIFHITSTQLTGSALNLVIDNFNLLNYVIYQYNIDGSSFSNSFCVQAGDYIVSVLGTTFTDRGLIDWYIDGELVCSGQDWYGGAAANVTQTFNVTISTSGNHVLVGTINGKNPASSNYNMGITIIWLKQASD